MTWAARPTDWGQPGHVDNGTEAESILDQIDELTDMGWDSWTPVWTSGGTQPAIGNGTLTGRIRSTDGGDLVQASLRMAAGSTTTFGTSTWFFSTPVSLSASAESDNAAWGWAYDASSTAIYVINARIESSVWRMGTGGGSVVLSTVPFTWANGDILCLNFAFEPA